jgi:hypothetical protein
MPIENSTRENIKGVTLRLLEYCRANDWAGYDPYDALNSRVFKALPFLNFKLFRLALTQAFKRSPINLRSLFLVPKTQNPKALALFLMALIKLSKLGLLKDEILIDRLLNRLEALRSPDPKYWCWGYSFPWQTRTIIVPRGQANIVCTTFVANALLDVYESSKDQKYLNIAASSAEYLLNDLFWERNHEEAGFSYPLPKLGNTVHNANFLGGALLCRVYSLTGEEKYLEPALKVARYSAGRQRENGSWDYGESGTQAWVDNFHTGYNLCALRSISQYAGTLEFESHIHRGFDFYRGFFFREDGAPKYFHNQTYPIDIHSVAQSILTLLAFKDLDANNVDLAQAVFQWTMTGMWNEEGYFYYQVFPFYISKIPHMRWSQAWMLLALSTLLNEFA